MRRVTKSMDTCRPSSHVYIRIAAAVYAVIRNFLASGAVTSRPTLFRPPPSGATCHDRFLAAGEQRRTSKKLTASFPRPNEVVQRDLALGNFRSGSVSDRMLGFIISCAALVFYLPERGKR
jgi:hypothetical protein